MAQPGSTAQLWLCGPAPGRGAACREANENAARGSRTGIARLAAGASKNPESRSWRVPSTTMRARAHRRPVLRPFTRGDISSLHLGRPLAHPDNTDQQSGRSRNGKGMRVVQREVSLTLFSLRRSTTGHPIDRRLDTHTISSDHRDIYERSRGRATRPTSHRNSIEVSFFAWSPDIASFEVAEITSGAARQWGGLQKTVGVRTTPSTGPSRPRHRLPDWAILSARGRSRGWVSWGRRPRSAPSSTRPCNGNRTQDWLMRLRRRAQRAICRPIRTFRPSPRSRPVADKGPVSRASAPSGPSLCIPSTDDRGAESPGTQATTRPSSAGASV